jgi:cytidylate kinase
VNQQLAVGISGGIGSGKTQVARQLAAALPAKLISFGDFVREQARRSGIEGSRENLQALGEELIADLGWEAFVRSVLAAWDRTGTVVIDGIRHYDAVRILRHSVSPAKFVLVHLAADSAVRAARLKAVRTTDARDLDRLDSHSTERDAQGTLQSTADVIVDAARALDEIVAEILRALPTFVEV